MKRWYRGGAAFIMLFGFAGAAACSSSGDGGSSRVQLHCETSGGVCTCGPAIGGRDPTPDATCSPDSLGGGYCCAGKGYPSSSTYCGCTYWGCTNSTDHCTCAAGSSGNDPACTQTFSHCCVPAADKSPTTCSCSNSACQADQREVADCGPEIPGCVDGDLAIASCTQ